MNQEDNKLCVELAVAKVDSGGNTEDGEYFYSYTPKLLYVEDSNVQIEYKLSADTEDHFQMLDMYTTDSKYQLSPGTLDENRRSLFFTNRNTEEQLIFLCVRVMDTAARPRKIINCDPQVLNRPPDFNPSR